MSSIVNLISTEKPAGGTPEDVVIVKYIDGIRGGRSLDVADFSPEVIRSGHLIIKKDDEELYKPLQPKADESGYEDKPAGYSFVGVVVGSVHKTRPMVGILTQGTVNPEACPYPMSAELITTLKADLPHIHFLKD